MNSKERVQNAVRQRPSDRVPTNYGHWPAGIPPANIAAWQETVASWPVAADKEKQVR